MQKNKSSKGLYLTLAILLTIQAVPFLGMFLNLLFVMQVAGIVISILALIYSKYDGRSKMGAIFGIVAFSMAIVSGVLFYMELDYVSESTAIFIMMWQVLNWFVVVAATIITYINTFKKTEMMYGNQNQHFYQQTAQQPFGGNMQSNNHNSTTHLQADTVEENMKSPLHHFEFTEIPLQSSEKSEENGTTKVRERYDEGPSLTDEVEE